MTELPKMDMSNNETGCCPKFDPTLWDEKEFTFDNLLFAKAKTRSFMYIPLNMGKVMTKAMALINQASATLPDRYLILSRDLTPWQGEHYFLVSKEVPGMTMSNLNGTYLTKVFDGEYRLIPKWIKEMEQYVKSQGKEMKNIYYFYTTCPKCAKHYGHNYVVLFVQI